MAFQIPVQFIPGWPGESISEYNQRISLLTPSNSGKWKTTKIPQGLYDKIARFAQSREAFDLGITSKSQAITYILREFLENKPLKSPEHEPIQ